MILKLEKFQGSKEPEMKANTLKLAFFDLNYISQHTLPVIVIWKQ